MNLLNNAAPRHMMIVPVATRTHHHVLLHPFLSSFDSMVSFLVLDMLLERKDAFSSSSLSIIVSLFVKICFLDVVSRASKNRANDLSNDTIPECHE